MCTCGVYVYLWCCVPVVLCTCGVVYLWCCLPVVLCTCGVVYLWCLCVPVVLCACGVVYLYLWCCVPVVLCTCSVHTYLQCSRIPAMFTHTCSTFSDRRLRQDRQHQHCRFKMVLQPHFMVYVLDGHIHSELQTLNQLHKVSSTHPNLCAL